MILAPEGLFKICLPKAHLFEREVLLTMVPEALSRSARRRLHHLRAGGPHDHNAGGPLPDRLADGSSIIEPEVLMLVVREVLLKICLPKAPSSSSWRSAFSQRLRSSSNSAGNHRWWLRPAPSWCDHAGRAGARMASRKRKQEEKATKDKRA